MTEETVTLERSNAPDGACVSHRPAARDDGPPRQRDDRFRRLLGPDAWQSLPPVVRDRFAKVLAPGTCRVFVGAVTETTLSRAGRCLARLAILVGSPLPNTDGAKGPATVVVTEDLELGGQIWTRTYGRPGSFPQTINSVKRFSGPTGMEEYLGRGLVMRLRLDAEGGALVFRSVGYDLVLGGRFFGGLRLPLPRVLTPGDCSITHRAEGVRRFTFTLALDHPWFGRLAHQVAFFEEVVL